MATFSTVALVENRRETPFASHLAFDVKDEGSRQSFTTPGQYAAIRLPGIKENLFAMSGCPLDGVWSFLVKGGFPLANRLISLKAGMTAELSPAQGKGFDMELCRGKNILLFAAGTGIAPLRSALLWMMKRRKDYLDVTLFTGARNPDEFAYAHEFNDWKKGGIEIVQTISNQKDSSWKGLFGHVQRHIGRGHNLIASEDRRSEGRASGGHGGASGKAPDTIALVCGMKGMIREVENRLTALGLPQKHILTNY